MSNFYTGSSYDCGNCLNYDNLLKKPIVNLIGVEQNPIILEDLDSGNYLIYGAYQYTSTSNLITVESKNVIIGQDESDNKKIALIEKVLGGEHYTVIIKYSSENSQGYTEKTIKTSDHSAEIKTLNTNLNTLKFSVETEYLKTADAIALTDSEIDTLFSEQESI